MIVFREIISNNASLVDIQALIEELINDEDDEAIDDLLILIELRKVGEINYNLYMIFFC